VWRQIQAKCLATAYRTDRRLQLKSRC
jgi:hypothetical protein